MYVVHASGCRDCIIIADKGFYSKKNVSALLDAGMKYILPLQDNTVNVETEFYENTDDNKWDGVFSFNKRAVWFRKKASGNKGNFIYTFRDDSHKAGDGQGIKVSGIQKKTNTILNTLNVDLLRNI